MTSKEEQEMVSSELLHMLEDVANREIPCQVAYAYIQKRLAASHAEGVEEGMDKLGEKCADAFNEGVQDTVEDLDLVTDAEAFARGVVEGEEKERERIRNGSKYLDCSDDNKWFGRPDGDVALSFWHVPAFVLAPKEVDND